ncbi:MAG: hypothetical protein ACLT8E_11925 [Akkermansia sp.]
MRPARHQTRGKTPPILLPRFLPAVYGVECAIRRRTNPGESLRRAAVQLTTYEDG